MAAPKDMKPPSAPLMAAPGPLKGEVETLPGIYVPGPAELDDIPDPAVPPSTVEPRTVEKAPSSPVEARSAPAALQTLPGALPEGFGAHEALLQGFCQHLQQRMHAWMMDEHRQLTQGMDVTMSAIRDYAQKVLQCNEHAEYQLASALSKLQEEGLPLLSPPYQAVLQVETPTGYALTLTVTKATSGALIEELSRVEGWLQSNGYKPTEVRI